MAKARREDKTKAKNDAIAPPLDLPAPRDVLARVSMLWDYLRLRDEDGDRRFHKLKLDKERGGAKRDYRSESTADEWLTMARELAQRAATDDGALFELIDRDPRFLASELVIARIVEWRIRVVLSRYSRGSDKEVARPPRLATTSQAKLKRVGAAISSTGRSGSSKHISSKDVADAEAYVRRKVGKAVKLVRGGCVNAAVLAKRVGLAGYASELQELVAKADAPEAVVHEILVAWFDVASIDRHRAVANRLGVSRRR